MQRADYKVTAQYLVRGPDRDATGHAFYFAAGRGWSKNWLQVSVVEGDINPTETYLSNEKTGEKGERVILDMITQAQLEELQADDHNMVVRPIGHGGDATDEKVDVPALIGEKTELSAKVAQLEGENARLKAKLVETNALLEEATKPAQRIVAKVANRRGG